MLDAALLTPRERIDPVAALVRREVQCLLFLAPSIKPLWNDSLVTSGIPIVSLGSLGQHSNGPESLGALEFAEHSARAALASDVCQSIGGAGTIACLSHHGEGANASSARAIRSVAAAFPKVAVRYVESPDPDLRASLVPALTARCPKLAAIVASSDKLAMAAVASYAAHGLTAPPIFGFGGSPDALVAVQRGELAGTVRLDADALSNAALAAAMEAVAGAVATTEVPIEFHQITKQNVDDVIAQTLRVQADLIADMTRRMGERAHTTDFLEQVIDALPLNLFVKEAANLRYIRINKARADWFGIEPEEHIGKCARELYPPDLAERFESSDREVLLGKKSSLPDEHPTVSPRPDASGGARWVQTYKLPILDSDGNSQYLVGITLDVNERKMAEIALAQRNEELEAAQLTMQKQQTKLVIAEKMASIGRLTAGIAHEMNTPLAAVRASMSELSALVDEYSDAIGDSSVLPDDHREIATEMKAAIAIADKSSARASAFVRGIKSQTRDLAGKPRIAFNAVSVVQESILLLSHALRDANCTTTFECSTYDSKTDFVELVGSPASFAQAVTNLVTNAIDASRPNGGEIRLELVSSGDRVSLRVTDFGCGIPQEVISNIFEPMFTTKPFGQGTGLGLSILHDIVTGEFDGAVEVHSTVGKGTTFELFLRPGIDTLIEQ